MSGPEAGENDPAFVGDTVAIPVSKVKYLRGGRDEHAALPAHHPGRPLQPIRENRGLLEPPVTVGVLQQLDPSQGFFPPLGVAPHFGHEHAASFIEGDRHRIHHLRFPGRQFDLESLPHHERPACLLQALARNARQLGGIRFGFGFRGRKNQAHEDSAPDCTSLHNHPCQSAHICVHPCSPFLPRHSTQIGTDLQIIGSGFQASLFRIAVPSRLCEPLPLGPRS